MLAEQLYWVLLFSILFGTLCTNFCRLHVPIFEVTCIVWIFVITGKTYLVFHQINYRNGKKKFSTKVEIYWFSVIHSNSFGFCRVVFNLQLGSPVIPDKILPRIHKEKPHGGRRSTQVSPAIFYFRMPRYIPIKSCHVSIRKSNNGAGVRNGCQGVSNNSTRLLFFFFSKQKWWRGNQRW